MSISHRTYFDQPLNRLCERNVLSNAEEKRLFHKLKSLQADINNDMHHTYCSNNAELQQRLSEINRLRNEMIESNQRLLVKVARKFSGPYYSLSELVAEGELSLLRCVELFDVSRGFCFSTYLTNALHNLFSRMVKREQKRLGCYVFREDITVSLPDEKETFQREEQFQFVSQLINKLSGRDRTIIEARYGLGEYDTPHTYRQIGNIVGLSKERVRVLAHRSIDLLSEHVSIHDACIISSVS